MSGFIEVYREQTCLWDVKSKDYANKSKINNSYEVLLSLIMHRLISGRHYLKQTLAHWHLGKQLDKTYTFVAKGLLPSTVNSRLSVTLLTATLG